MSETLLNNTDNATPISKTKLSRTMIVSVLMLIISIVVAILVFKNIFSYEMKHAYTADAPLYWAVGRGMLNGLTPYADLYENKPIGVFLISALSFKLTGGTILCNIVSCAAALMIAALPALFLFDMYKDDKSIGKLRKATVTMAVFLSCLLLAVYAEKRSGGFQVEAIGAAFSVLFICLVIKLKNAESKKSAVILTALAAVAISCTVMMKEPFLVVSVFGALLFIDSFKSFLKAVVIPCAVGGAATILGLAVSGTLSPYFSIYIKRMFETRLSGQGSALSTALNISRLADDLKDFSIWLLIILAFFIFLSLFGAAAAQKGVTGNLFHIFKTAVSILAASFCVGMGVYYFNHHFIFAVPVYCSLVICGGKTLHELSFKKGVVSSSVIVLWGVTVVFCGMNINNPYAGDYTQKYESIVNKAEYVDSLLDFYGEDRYQFIGFNGEDVFFGLTKHSPQGPAFAQDPDNFRSADTWFSKSLIEQLDNSNIVIVKDYMCSAINDRLQDTLNRDFTDHPIKIFDIKPPQDFTYKIYYRASKFADSQTAQSPQQ